MRRVWVKIENKQETCIAELTRPDPRRPGHVLHRSELVERQIREALTLDPNVLIERAKLEGYNSPQYFKEECLVYLIRKYLQEGRDELANSLVASLQRRCSKHIHIKVRALLAPTYIDDCFADAVGAVFTPILDLKTDRGDFAQVLFQVFLEYQITHVLRRYMKLQRQDSKTDSLDVEPDEKGGVPLVHIPRVGQDNVFNQAVISKGLELLPWRQRVALFMYYYGGWDIDNKDPNVLTISKHFGASERTIRRWITAAEEQLRLRQGDKQ